MLYAMERRVMTRCLPQGEKNHLIFVFSIVFGIKEFIQEQVTV